MANGELAALEFYGLHRVELDEPSVDQKADVSRNLVAVVVGSSSIALGAKTEAQSLAIVIISLHGTDRHGPGISELVLPKIAGIVEHYPREALRGSQSEGVEVDRNLLTGLLVERVCPG